MTRIRLAAALAGTLLSPQVLAAPPAEDAAAAVAPAPPPSAKAPEPDLSAAAIDRAVFADWEGRRKAQAERKNAADAAAPSQTPPPEALETDAAPAGEGAAAQAAAKNEETPDPFLIRMQVLLDRAHVSPGVIDGLDGGNTAKAVRAYEAMHDLKADGRPDARFWEVLAADQGKATMSYTLTREDLDQRYVPDLPTDYGDLAKLDWLGYRDAAEMLAERFHMDEDLLRRLNPGADFKSEGQTILVADTGAPPETKVARIVVDKERGELFAYDENDKLVLADPATIGSSDTPSPSGTVKVNGSAPDPTYAYNPDKNFRQGGNDRKLTLPAGPNGPVGNVWIDLSKPTYGIHGTPEPSKIDKTASHGCVRLTNWDAQALSKLVRPGRTVVEFKT